MDLNQLLKIKNETERFRKVLNDSIDMAREYPGYELSFEPGVMYRVNDISDTHQCGHLKREWLSLKFNLNKMI